MCSVPGAIPHHAALQIFFNVETYFFILTSQASLGKQRQPQGISCFTKEIEDNTLLFFNVCVLPTLFISFLLPPCTPWAMSLGPASRAKSEVPILGPEALEWL